MKLLKFSLVALFLGVLLLSLGRDTSTQITQPLFTCDQSAIINQPTATTTRYIQNDSTSDNPTRIRICNIFLTLVGAATANQITFLYGTGSTCGTGTVNLGGTVSAATAGVVNFFNYVYPFKPVPVLNNWCITTSQAVASGVLGSVSFSIF